MKTSQIIAARNKEYSSFRALSNTAIALTIFALALACLLNVFIAFIVFIIAIGFFSISTAPYNRSKQLNSKLSVFDKWNY